MGDSDCSNKVVTAYELLCNQATQLWRFTGFRSGLLQAACCGARMERASPGVDEATETPTSPPSSLHCRMLPPLA